MNIYFNNTLQNKFYSRFLKIKLDLRVSLKIKNLKTIILHMYSVPLKYAKQLKLNFIERI